MHFITTKKRIIEAFAQEIAELQRKSDVYYYEKDDQQYSSWLLDQVRALRIFTCKLGICNAVYKRACEIYDFQSSGKNGYILKNGIISREVDYGTD